MEKQEELVGVLNDLIQINNDRVVGYERAINELKDEDADLRTVFQSYATNSSRHVVELTEEVIKAGGHPTDGTTNSGKIYRAWMDVKATFTGNDRKTILASCEFGEDAAQRAYEAAIASDAEMDADVRQLITEQQKSLKNSHDMIKKYRDAHNAMS